MDGFGAEPRRVEMADGKKYSDMQAEPIEKRFKDLPLYEVIIGNRHVSNGFITADTYIGPVGDVSKDEDAWTEHRYNHTHPSGVGSKSEKDKWQQAPSTTDIKNSNSMIRRVWGMGSKTIYLFNKDGVKATIPFSVYGR